MTIQTDFLPAGHAVTDEVCVCNQPVSIGGVTYYADYLMELADESIIGNTDADYGAWTAASKGGTRYDVIRNGVPGAGDVCVDFTTGRALCLTLGTTLYFRYLGYGRPSAGWRFQDHVWRYFKPGFIDSTAGVLTLSTEEIFYYGAGFGAGQFWLDNAPVGAALKVRISKGAGETASTQDIVIADGSAGSSFTEFSVRLKFHPTEHLKISVLQAKNGFPTNLYGVLYPR